MKISGYHKELGNNVTLVINYRDLFSKYIELPKNEKPNFDFIIYDDITKKNYVRYYRVKVWFFILW